MVQSAAVNQPSVAPGDQWNWEKEFNLKDIPVTGMPGPSEVTNHCVIPADFLGLFFSDTVLDTLVFEEINYATRSREDTPSNMSWILVTILPENVKFREKM